MKVKAKYQIAYKQKLICGGEVFEINENELSDLKNDVEVLTEKKETKEIKKPKK